MMKKALAYVVLILLAVAAIGPLLWVASTAFKSPAEDIFAYPPRFLPQRFTLENYAQVFASVPFFAFLLNSVVAGVLTVIFNVGTSVLAAYPLARMRFAGQGAVFQLILATMMIPFQVIIVPLFNLTAQLGLTDQQGIVGGWLGLVVPFAVSGFGVFFVRQAMLSLPHDLEESAVLDGCNSWQTLWHVLLPLMTPTLATLAVFSFMTSWGDFLWPSLTLNAPENFTLPVGLVQLEGAFSANWRVIAAGTVLSMLPVIAFFLALQRYFIPGQLEGSIKG